MNSHFTQVALQRIVRVNFIGWASPFVVMINFGYKAFSIFPALPIFLGYFGQIKFVWKKISLHRDNTSFSLIMISHFWHVFFPIVAFHCIVTRIFTFFFASCIVVLFGSFVVRFLSLLFCFSSLVVDKLIIFPKIKSYYYLWQSLLIDYQLSLSLNVRVWICLLSSAITSNCCWGDAVIKQWKPWEKFNLRKEQAFVLILYFHALLNELIILTIIFGKW